MIKYEIPWLSPRAQRLNARQYITVILCLGSIHNNLHYTTVRYSPFELIWTVQFGLKIML